MAKKTPTDVEIKELLSTPKAKLPKDRLHEKRLKFVEDKLISVAKEIRDLLDEGVAKERVFEQLVRVRDIARKAIIRPNQDPAVVTARGGVVARKPTDAETEQVKKAMESAPLTPATDPVPSDPPPYPSMDASNQDPPNGTGLGELAVPPDTL